MYKEENRERREPMRKEEFEDLIGQALSDGDYEIIETVYLYHPAIRDTSGKEELAELYKSFGMTIFYDLIGRAKRHQELENQLHHTQAEVERIKEEMIQNRASMGLDYSRMLDKLDTPKVEERKSPRDIASKVVDIFNTEYSDGFALADVREIFSIIEECFKNLQIKLEDGEEVI